MMIGNKLNFLTVDFDAQMLKYFMMRVANFEPLYLKQFLVKIQSFCAYWTGNFLNFSKLTKLLSVAHLSDTLQLAFFSGSDNRLWRQWTPY